jgi:hypothetical protein
MTTLAVVEEILRETAAPMSVREIVERAGVRLPSKSKTPDTVVARDLSMDLKKKGESSLFARTSPGRYTLRELVTPAQSVSVSGAPAQGAQAQGATTPIANLSARKPAVSASGASGSSGTSGVSSTVRTRTDREADGGVAG